MTGCLKSRTDEKITGNKGTTAWSDLDVADQTTYQKTSFKTTEMETVLYMKMTQCTFNKHQRMQYMFIKKGKSRWKKGRVCVCVFGTRMNG